MQVGQSFQGILTMNKIMVYDFSSDTNIFFVKQHFQYHSLSKDNIFGTIVLKSNE